MTKLAITGHRGLPDDTERLVDTALREEIAGTPEVVGVSCLADGADSLFARAVLDHGGELVVIVPAARYREGLPTEHHPIYDALMARASDVVRLDHVESTSRSHMDASLEMIERADRLIAVWDGEPARGYGGTADIVEAARDRGIPTTVIWPEGARRD
ncbi:hypothetical protein CDG81_20705 [Actinopolyspora erythraea]|uniref:DUF2493 domain-containing protein n=1 Tax=Actinopolyspora erythraea TaxID=414996 RepID=A0A099D9A9_9ACTN|nr:hypothetical protein [Actinopolyspora erythraea]ASU80291.1 hypothetical protein CDG81_20705 [Actinopolyspora erythraea]KGI82629.1 hypothetical protein IL38_04170 [Actinopolyspora erythraea]